MKRVTIILFFCLVLIYKIKAQIINVSKLQIEQTNSFNKSLISFISKNDKYYLSCDSRIYILNKSGILIDSLITYNDLGTPNYYPCFEAYLTNKNENLFYCLNKSEFAVYQNEEKVKSINLFDTGYIVNSFYINNKFSYINCTKFEKSDDKLLIIIDSNFNIKKINIPSEYLFDNFVINNKGDLYSIYKDKSVNIFNIYTKEKIGSIQLPSISNNNDINNYKLLITDTQDVLLINSMYLKKVDEVFKFDNFKKKYLKQLTLFPIKSQFGNSNFYDIYINGLIYSTEANHLYVFEKSKDKIFINIFRLHMF